MGGGEEQMHFWAHSPLVPYMLDLVIVPGWRHLLLHHRACSSPCLNKLGWAVETLQQEGRAAFSPQDNPQCWAWNKVKQWAAIPSGWERNDHGSSHIPAE